MNNPVVSEANKVQTGATGTAGHSKAGTGAAAALVAAWWILNDFAGLAAFAGAYFFNPLLAFAASFVVFGAIELVCCMWVDANWDRWAARVGPQMDGRIERWRQGRLMRHPVRWVTSDSSLYCVLSALLTSGLTVVTVSRLLTGQPVGKSRIRVAVLAYALFVSGVFCVSGYLARLGLGIV